MWLDDAHSYLGSSSKLAEDTAERLKKLIDDPDAGPVLVPATSWPEHWQQLTTQPRRPLDRARPAAEEASSACAPALFQSATYIQVPIAFGTDELATARGAADRDPRLALALKYAASGKITQYLAGAAKLIERYRTAPPPLEIAARWPRQVTALVLLCAGMPGHEPSDPLRAFGRREGELIEAGDIAGAVELNVETWLGPEADERTRGRVRRMQRHAFDVQLAAAQEHEPAGVAVELRAITAPSLVVSGAKDLPDFRLIAARLAGLLPGARLVELPWAGHLPTLERPHELSQLLTVFLRETVPSG